MICPSLISGLQMSAVTGAASRCEPPAPLQCIGKGSVPLCWLWEAFPHLAQSGSEVLCAADRQTCVHPAPASLTFHSWPPGKLFFTEISSTSHHKQAMITFGHPKWLSTGRSGSSGFHQRGRPCLDGFSFCIALGTIGA